MKRDGQRVYILDITLEMNLISTYGRISKARQAIKGDGRELCTCKRNGSL